MPSICDCQLSMRNFVNRPFINETNSCQYALYRPLRVVAGGGTIGHIAGSKHSRLVLCKWLPLYLAAESKATKRHLTIASSLSNPTIFALTNNTGSLSHLGTGLPKSSSRPCLPNGLITQLSPWMTQNPGTSIHQLSLHWQFRTLSVNIKWIDN